MTEPDGAPPPEYPPDGFYPDGKSPEESRYTGRVTATGLPIPKPRVAHNRERAEGSSVRTDEYRAIRDAMARARSHTRTINPEYQEWAQRKRRQRKNLRRPGWWRPGQILEKLENGERITNLVEQAVKDCGGRVKRRILYRDIATWRRMWPGFAEAYTRAREVSRGGVVPAEMWDEFFQTMIDFDGKVENACEAMCIGRGIVMAMIDPALPKTYNKQFAERFRAAEAERYAEVRQKFFNKAERGDGDTKVQAMLLETGLPHLHGKKVKVDVEGTINHRLEAAAEEQVVQRSRALFAGRERALPAAPEPITIDVVAQVVTEEAS